MGAFLFARNMNPNVQAAQNALTAFQGSQKSANDLLNGAMSQYGVQGAQTTAQNLENTINNTQKALNAVPDSVTGRTSRSLVTEAQRQAIVNNEQNPIREALTAQQGEYGTASDNYKTLLGEATNLANSELTDQSNKEAQLEQNYQDASNAAAAQLAAQQEAAKEAETQREFNITAAQNAQKISASNASNTVNPDEAAMGFISSGLGGDGYVSPSTFELARKAYVQAGGSAGQFAKDYWKFTGVDSSKGKGTGKNAGNWKAYYYG